MRVLRVILGRGLGRALEQMYDGNSDYWEDSDTLTVTQSFEEGDEGWFGAAVANYADVYSPVPEPATMLLLGSGLVGLAGLGGKKFFKKS